MNRLVPPAIAILVATYFVGNAARQMSAAGSALTVNPPVTATPAADSPADPPAAPAAKPRSPITRAVIERPAEPVDKSLIHCLTDLDDLLDTVHDAASFAAVKPKLLARVREQADYAAGYPGQGMGRLSKSAAKELQTAMNRHSESLERTIQVAPDVKPFFEKELAAILNRK